MPAERQQEGRHPKERLMRSGSIALISILCAALASPASADNDKDKGNGHGGGPKADKSDNDHGRGNNGDHGNNGPVSDQHAIVVPYQQVVIVDRDRNVVHTYYRTEYAAGRCPPGLAKKNNGCLPPGQAKKLWAMGQPLPSSVVFYPLPGSLLGMLTPAPAGYQYVRVASDILMMAIGTRMIVGALADLSSM